MALSRVHRIAGQRELSERTIERALTLRPGYVSAQTARVLNALAVKKFSAGKPGADAFVAYAQALREAYADRLATAPWPPKAAASQYPEQWAVESCRLAKGVYPASHVMDRAYLDQQRPLAELRIRQAAYRLATLLDASLGTHAE